jgi:hypothetical protein
MKIVHFVPFAPNACGLYEAARDMIIADFLSGHEVHLVDTGTVFNDVYTPGYPGKEDIRGGSFIVTSDPAIVNTADIIIAHSGVPDNWLSPCQAPIIWVLHGRPAACFRPEQFKKGHSYTLMANLAQWPRVKKMLSFWPHHTKYWEPIVPKDKLVCLPAPPIDNKRFSPEGPVYDYGEFKGKWNILLCDSWREDIDIYEIVHGAIEAGKIIEGIKFHFCSVEVPLGPWELIFNKMRQMNILGEVSGRMINMEERYRASDIILTPHHIAVRTIGEALTIGKPVIAAKGCNFTPYTAIPDEPIDIANTICSLIKDLTDNKKFVTDRVLEISKSFSLEKYSERMNRVYDQIA